MQPMIPEDQAKVIYEEQMRLGRLQRWMRLSNVMLALSAIVFGFGLSMPLWAMNGAPEARSLAGTQLEKRDPGSVVAADPALRRVTCITRDRSDQDRSIDYFDGAFGQLSLDALIQRMRTGERYWLAGPPSALLEIVERSAKHRAHVRTVPDGRYDNLYALPECPS